jgi:repressor LexA
MKQLTEKQARVLEIISQKIGGEGIPPTLEELRDDLELSSKNAVLTHLEALVKKGYIQRSSKARDIRILKRLDQSEEIDHSIGLGLGLELPLVGTVTAGSPVLTEENIERYVYVPHYLVNEKQPCFALHVQGDSMLNAGIHDGDLVIVQSTSQAKTGDIVVALIGNEVTVKRLIGKGKDCYLKAENPDYSDIRPKEPWELQGKVLALIREQIH